MLLKYADMIHRAINWSPRKASIGPILPESFWQPLLQREIRLACGNNISVLFPSWSPGYIPGLIRCVSAWHLEESCYGFKVAWREGEHVSLIHIVEVLIKGILKAKREQHKLPLTARWLPDSLTTYIEENYP